MVDKKTVARHFSRAAETYDSYAIVQQEMASTLAGYLPDLPVDGDILEIGSGTGMVTRHLVSRYPGRKLQLLDISKAMTEYCSRKFGEFRTVFATRGDGETFPLEKESQALIVSGAAFQWYREPEAAIQRYLEALIPGGYLLFSTFGPGTFRELYTAFKLAYRDLGIPFTHTQGQMLLSLDRWRRMLSGYTVLRGDVAFRELFYSSVGDFLHALQKTGANNAERERGQTPPAAVRGMMAHYKAACPDRIRVSYETLFLCARKPAP